MDPSAALKRRLEPVLTERATARLITLLDHGRDFTASDDGTIGCRFADRDDTWRIRPPLAELPRSGRIPEAYRRFLAVCGGMEWGDVGDTGQLVLGHGFDGTLACLGSDALNGEKWGIELEPPIFSPIDLDLQDFYFVHPVTRRLCLHSEGLVAEVRDTDDPVEIYLRELHLALRDARVDDGFRDAPDQSSWLVPLSARGA